MLVVLAAGCGSGGPPPVSDDTRAAAAAERKAVADTDGAERDAARTPSLHEVANTAEEAEQN